VLRLGALLAILLLAIESAPFARVVREPLCRLIAFSSAAFLSLFGFEPLQSGNTICLGGFEVRVIEDCDGIFLLAVFVAAVVALPTARGARAWLLAAPSLALLVAANWIRIPVLSVIGARRPDAFEFVHATVFQWGLVVLLVALWLRWASRARSTPGA
jgi:exosortase/archaeosortase family protein